MNKFVQPRPLADPEAAARWLDESGTYAKFAEAGGRRYLREWSTLASTPCCRGSR
jgi:hypothetical protein